MEMPPLSPATVVQLKKFIAAEASFSNPMDMVAGAAGKELTLYQRKIEAGQLPLQDLYHLSRAAAIGKMISVAFYFGEINLASFQRKFGVTVEDVFPHEVAFVLQRGLMEYTDSTLRLTTDGARQVNGVIALFYAPAVKEHLLQLSRADGETAGKREGATAWQSELALA